jgi:hypothetical protein
MLIDDPPDIAVRDALRAGTLSLPRSCHHVSFSYLIYRDERWEREREGTYEQLALFSEGDKVVAQLTQEFEYVARTRHATSSTVCLRTTPFSAYVSTSPTHMGSRNTSSHSCVYWNTHSCRGCGI